MVQWTFPATGMAFQSFSTCAIEMLYAIAFLKSWLAYILFLFLGRLNTLSSRIR